MTCRECHPARSPRKELPEAFGLECASAARPRLEVCGARGIGGVVHLDRDLVEGDVSWRTEGRDGREQPRVLAFRAQVHGDRDVGLDRRPRPLLDAPGPSSSS